MAMQAAEKENRFAVHVKSGDGEAVRALKIKTNVLKRLVKDVAFRDKEVVQDAERLAKMKAEESERVAQQEQVLSETRTMLAQARNKLQSAVQEMGQFLTETSVPADDELVATARAAIVEAQKALQEE